jgi:hypothetical protein
MYGCVRVVAALDTLACYTAIKTVSVLQVVASGNRMSTRDPKNIQDMCNFSNYIAVPVMKKTFNSMQEKNDLV